MSLLGGKAMGKGRRDVDSQVGWHQSPSEAGFHCHCGCAPAPPNLSGALSSTEGSQVQELFTRTNKSSDSGQPGSSSKTPACQQVGSAAAALHLLQLQNAHHCLGSGYPQNRKTADGALPHTLVIWLCPFPCFFSTDHSCWLVRLEWTGHHFYVIFLESQQHLTLFLLVGCQEGQLPSDIFGGGNHSGEALQYLQTHI